MTVALSVTPSARVTTIERAMPRSTFLRGPIRVPMPAARNCPMAYVMRYAAQMLPREVADQPVSTPIAALAAENGLRQK